MYPKRSKKALMTFSNSEEIFETKWISKLIMERLSLIESISISTKRTGKHKLVPLCDGIARETFKSWLSKRVVEKWNATIGNRINSSLGKYSLTYLGQTPLPGSNNKIIQTLYFRSKEHT